MAKEKEHKRPDGRKANEIRKITAKVGIIPNADGSSSAVLPNPQK